MITMLAPPLVKKSTFLFRRIYNPVGYSAFRLTSVIAAAGYGKTTLLAQHYAAALTAGKAVAWMTLDEDDNEPCRFLQKLYSATHNVAHSVSAQASLSDGTHIETMIALRQWLASVLRQQDNLLLFIDNFHQVHHPEIHAVISWLLQHSPDQFCYFLASRHVLPLKISSLRLAGELREITCHDLRLEQTEIEPFVFLYSGRSINGTQAKTLYERTEGWPTGLQLAATSLRDVDNVDNASRMITNFSGYERQIAQYLEEQVLADVSPAIFHFMLYSAQFDSFTIDFCRQALYVPATAKIVDTLLSQNLLIIPLDYQGHHYRYHFLLTEYLRRRLLREHGRELTTHLHATATTWCEQRGHIVDAIHHAKTAGHDSRVHDLLMTYAHRWPLVDCKYDHLFLTWIGRMSRNDIIARPVVGLRYFRALLSNHHIEQAAELLDALEQAINALAAADADEAGLDHLHQHMALSRAALQLRTENHSQAEEILLHFLRRWEQSNSDYHLALAMGNMGELAYHHHHYDQARHWFKQHKQRLNKCNFPAGFLTEHTQLWRVLIELAEGNICNAERVLNHAIDHLQDNTDETAIAACTHLQLLRAPIHYEKNELALAEEILSVEFTPVMHSTHMCEIVLKFHLTRARLLWLAGESDNADRILKDNAHNVKRLGLHSIAQFFFAERVHLLLRSGLKEQALALVENPEYQFTLPQNLDHAKGRAFFMVHLTHIRLNLSMGRPEKTTLSIAALLAEARHGKHSNCVAKLLCLQANQQSQLGHDNAARKLLEEALGIAAFNSLYRTIVDEWIPIDGTEFPELIQQISKRWSQQRGRVDVTESQLYLQKLIVAYNNAPHGPHVSETDATSITFAANPFSEREQQILKLLTAGVGNREMAEQLFVSEATVKWHLQNIYRKLNVSNRTSAVDRARRLVVL